MEWPPATSPAVAKTAVPPETWTVPSGVLPSVNAIVPPAVLGETVAVKLTFWPKLEGFSDDVKPVVVTFCTTFRVTEVEVLAVKAPLPP
jgi:hypothetical protein